MARENLSQAEQNRKEVSPDEKLPEISWGTRKEGHYTAYSSEDRSAIYYIFTDGKVGLSNARGEEIKLVNESTEEGRKALLNAYALESRYSQILDARDKLAKKLAEGDPVKERIFTNAIAGAEGSVPEPEKIINGIELYNVGGNATHEALLGVKDGRVYFLCNGPEIYLLPDTEIDKTGLTVETWIDDMIEIIISELYERSLNDNFLARLGGMSDKKFSIHDEDNNEFEASFERLKAVFGKRIREVVEPLIRKYADLSRRSSISNSDNHIVIDLGNGETIRLFLHRMPEDVTDRDSIYIGRGESFPIKTPEVPPVDKKAN